MKTVLFVTYGGGHVKMVVPVARALAASGLARPLVLALTTAAPVVRAAGLPMLQFKDLVRPQDAAALRHGQQLMAHMSEPVIDPEETQAYLGLCYAELVQRVGEEEAAQRYQRDGRHAFLPLSLMTRVLQDIAPDLLVATNSPRAERAAIEAARTLGLPAVCLVDLFALDDVGWTGAPGYANRVCVLDHTVRQFLIDAGRPPHEVVVTGNPGFDDLFDPRWLLSAQALRTQYDWGSRRMVLWVQQVEPAVHPFTGQPGDPELPKRIWHALLGWVLTQPDLLLGLRYRPGQDLPAIPSLGSVVVLPPELPLASVLHLTDTVVVLNSTVGLEGHLLGTKVIQVLGSVFDQAVPFLAYGVADVAVPCEGLAAALTHCVGLPRRQPQLHLAKNASLAVLAVLQELLSL